MVGEEEGESEEGSSSGGSRQGSGDEGEEEDSSRGRGASKRRKTEEEAERGEQGGDVEATAAQPSTTQQAGRPGQGNTWRGARPGGSNMEEREEREADRRAHEGGGEDRHKQHAGRAEQATRRGDNHKTRKKNVGGGGPGGKQGGEGEACRDGGSEGEQGCFRGEDVEGGEGGPEDGQQEEEAGMLEMVLLHDVKAGTEVRGAGQPLVQNATGVGAGRGKARRERRGCSGDRWLDMLSCLTVPTSLIRGKAGREKQGFREQFEGESRFSASSLLSKPPCFEQSSTIMLLNWAHVLGLMLASLRLARCSTRMAS
jgi:hypothetical protein